MNDDRNEVAVGHGVTAWEIPRFRVRAEVADEDDLIY